jgi:cell shape-determining protein MreC
LTRRTAPWGYLAAAALSIGLLVISGWSVVTDAQAAGARVVAPMQEAVHQASLAVVGVLETVGSIGQLRTDNDALRNDLAGAEARIVALRRVEAENAALRELLAIRAAW